MLAMKRLKEIDGEDPPSFREIDASGEELPELPVDDDLIPLTPVKVGEIVSVREGGPESQEMKIVDFES